MLTEAIKSLKSKLHKNLNSHDKRAKIQDADFVSGLLQALAQAKGNFSLASLRLAVCVAVGATINRSSFNERMATASLVDHVSLALKSLVKSMAAHECETTKVISSKLGVQGVVGIDGSLVSLWDGLKGHFKGTFTTASIKLHLAVDLISGAITWFEFTPGATHDNNQRFPKICSGFRAPVKMFAKPA